MDLRTFGPLANTYCLVWELVNPITIQSAICSLYQEMLFSSSSYYCNSHYSTPYGKNNKKPFGTVSCPIAFTATAVCNARSRCSLRHRNLLDCVTRVRPKCSTFSGHLVSTNLSHVDFSTVLFWLESKINDNHFIITHLCWTFMEDVIVWRGSGFI